MAEQLNSLPLSQSVSQFLAKALNKKRFLMCVCVCVCWNRNFVISFLVILLLLLLVIVPWDVDDDVYMNSYACTCGARVVLLVVVGDLCKAKCEKSELIWLMVCVSHRVPNEPANNQTMDETCIQMTSLTLVNAETLPHMIICCSPKKLKHCCATPNKYYYDKVMFISMIMKYGCSKRCSTFCEKRNEKRRCMEMKAENVWPNIYVTNIAAGSNSTHRHTHTAVWFIWHTTVSSNEQVI